MQVASLFDDHRDLLDEFIGFLPGHLGWLGRNASAQKLRIKDALTYLKEVKDMFQGQIEKYDAFLDLMNDYKAQRFDLVGGIARVKELFRGPYNLIFGFNTFLPKGYEIIDPDMDDKDAVKCKYSKEFTFCENVKNRLSNPDDYQTFLRCLHIYSSEIITRKELESLDVDLLREHKDLTEEFIAFLEHCENIDIDSD
ncbi:hypothetical protein LXL04_013325 [Taraxacum kok-saghyz]